MIRTENMTINGRVYVHTWSDAYRYVVRNGISYDEVIDPAEFGRTYTEGDIMPDTNDDAQNILNIILGDTE